MCLPDRNSKLSPRFIESHYVLKRQHGNKNGVYDLVLNKSETVHTDRKYHRTRHVMTKQLRGLLTVIKSLLTHSYILRSRD